VQIDPIADPTWRARDARSAIGHAALVVFDCDGVLVDSERLAIRVEAEVLGELGWALSEAEVTARFVGRSAAYMQAEVERQLGREIDWEETFGRRHREAFDAELVAIDGVGAVLDALLRRATPICVASSSTHGSIEYKLRRTGLWDVFAGRVFSVEDVAHAKPAPDVFQHAARAMGVAPADCAVVEDSRSGVEAVARGRHGGLRVRGRGHERRRPRAPGRRAVRRHGDAPRDPRRRHHRRDGSVTRGPSPRAIGAALGTGVTNGYRQPPTSGADRAVRTARTR
jgi:HAD superfamily hydrolase (TIGR01509 family)